MHVKSGNEDLDDGEGPEVEEESDRSDVVNSVVQCLDAVGLTRHLAIERRDQTDNHFPQPFRPEHLMILAICTKLNARQNSAQTTKPTRQ